MIYKNAQKQHVRDVESTSLYLIDWQKQETIWHTEQDVEVIATSQNGYFVYHDVDACAYYLLVCGSSVVTPIPLLTNLKPKGESRFLSNGTFVFHGEKRIVVLDIDSSTILAQYDVTRHACDLMTLSRFDYKPKPKPVEVCITMDDDVKGDNLKGNDVDDKKHVAEIQAMVDTTKPSDVVPPVDVVKPIEVMKPIDPKPMDVVKPVEPIATVDIVKSSEVDAPVEVQKPIEVTPVGDVKPVDATAASSCSIM